MAATLKSPKSLANRLKKQLTALRRKEKAERNELRSAILKVKKLMKTHKSTLNKLAKSVKRNAARKKK